CYSSTTVSKPPYINRLPSKGMGFTSGCKRGSSIILGMALSLTAREGHSIHENTTVSPGWHFTAIGNDVTLPSGTSSPQHSTILVAPYSLNTAAASVAWRMYLSLFAAGTAATNPSI